MEKLSTFFSDDEIEDFRAFPQMRREAFGTSERTYVDQINECITEGLKFGQAVRNPERGLHYVVLSEQTRGVEQVLSSLQINGTVWPFFVNQAKIERRWAPYFPFILTIQRWEHLWGFIRGDYSIVGFVEIESLCQIAIDSGYVASFDPEDVEYPLHVREPGHENGAKISSHILTRIGMEFVSPEWVVLSAIEVLMQNIRNALAENSAAPST